MTRNPADCAGLWKKEAPGTKAILWSSLCFLMVRAMAVASDWPQWRGPGRDGRWHEEGLADAFPPGGPPVVWRVPVGSGWSSAVVSAGRVVITDVKVEGGAAKDRVVCLEETTGRPVWTHEYVVAYPAWALEPSEGGPRATPLIHQGKVYTLGALGHLFCLDLAEGGVVWEKNLARDYGVQAFTGISGSPLMEGEVLILQLCAKPDAGVVAFDANTGREAWRALNDTFVHGPRGPDPGQAHPRRLRGNRPGTSH